MSQYLVPFLQGLDDEHAAQQIRVASKVLGACNTLSLGLTDYGSGVDGPLCMITSAPHLNGYCRGGGANVESTSRCPPTA